MRNVITYAAEALYALLNQYWSDQWEIEPDKQTKALMSALEAYIRQHQR